MNTYSLSYVRLAITRQPDLHLLSQFSYINRFIVVFSLIFLNILSILAVVSQRFDRNDRRHIVRLLSGTQFSYLLVDTPRVATEMIDDFCIYTKCDTIILKFRRYEMTFG